MDLQITGKVIQVLEEQTGEGRNGPWRKREFVLETPGQYPKQVCLVHWGDKIDEFAVKEGETLTASIDIQSREYNGRWYTDVKAWKVERPQAGGGSAPGDGPPPFADEPWPDDDAGGGGGDDDLPF
jgi:hypothetical protein